MNNKLMGWRIDRERQERATLAAQASYVNACAVADDLRKQRDRAEVRIEELKAERDRYKAGYLTCRAGLEDIIRMAVGR